MKTNDYKVFVTSFFQKLKNASSPLKLPITHQQKIIAYLRLITKNILGNNKEIQLLSTWRDRNQHWFPSQFKVTFEGTKRWAKQQLIEKEDRILFFIESNDNPIRLIGHLGLNRFDFRNRACQIDNVIRGTPYLKGIMTYALQALIEFSFKRLDLKYLTLTTFEDNERAIALYERCGFKAYKKIPLEKQVKNGEIAWIPNKSRKAIERFDLEMILTSSNRN